MATEATIDKQKILALVIAESDLDDVSLIEAFMAAMQARNPGMVYRVTFGPKAKRRSG